MKKTRRKLRLWSAILALLLTVLYTLPAFSAVVPGEEPIEPQTLDPGFMQPLTSYETEHSYDEGIVDGAVYYLRNAYNGQYLDVVHAADANNTDTCTYTFHGGPNQQFRIHYISQGLYEIVPVYSQRRLHMASNHDLVIYDKNWGGEQKFKIAMLNSNTGMIFPQYGNFTRALAWDETRPDMVASKPLSAMSSHSHAYWIFERVGTTADMYAKFYLRYNGQHQQRIDVIEGYTAEGSLVHACPVPYGNVNQEWKTYYDENDGCYYLRPGNSFDMALDYRGTNLAIYRGTNPATQGFQIMQSSTLDEATGKPLYALKTSQNTYVTMGIGMGGGVNEPYSYIGTTTTPTFCWFLEGVPHDSKKPDSLVTLNGWLWGNVEPGYIHEQYFYFTPEKTSRYKIELKDGNVDFGSITSEWGIDAEIANRKTYNGIRVADVFCEAGVTYYVTVYSKNPVDGSATNFSIRARQLTAVAHSCNDEDGNTADFVIWAFDSLIEDMNYRFLHREDMTVSQAEETCVSLTGYRDFNAEIFVYAGHGLYGNARYDGTNIWNSFDANSLPDMSNCDLAIWACCNSASPTSGDSMGSVSYENGAKVVFSWKGKIKNSHLECFLFHLFDSLNGGATISAAKNYALSKLMENSTYIPSEVEDFVNDIEVYGDEQFIVFPITTNNISLQNISVVESAVIANPDDYTLVAENDSVGWKMYARMINGIMADDYYIEFYDGNKLIGVQKSCYTMTNADVADATTQINQYVLENSNLQSDSNAESSEYVICYISNEWRLIEKVAVTSGECNCCVEYVYYDVVTGEVILQ